MDRQKNANPGQTKKQEEPNPVKKLNQQANFYIMRRLWQIVRGKSEAHQHDTIYGAFGISRERYTRFINGDGARFSRNELDSLVEDTGIPIEVFTGEALLFQVEKIGVEGWQGFFELRSDPYLLNKRVKQGQPESQSDDKSDDDNAWKISAYRAAMVKIDNDLKAQSKKNNQSNGVFYHTIFFIQHKFRYDFGKQKEELLKQQIASAENHTVSWLYDIKPELLTGYLAFLENQCKYVRSILVVQEGLNQK